MRSMADLPCHGEPLLKTSKHRTGVGGVSDSECKPLVKDVGDINRKWSAQLKGRAMRFNLSDSR